MSNVIALPVNASAAYMEAAVLEAKLALMRVLTLSHGAKNLTAMADAERLHDLSWRLGNIAAHAEQTLNRINTLTPTKKSEPDGEGDAHA